MVLRLTVVERCLRLAGPRRGLLLLLLLWGWVAALPLAARRRCGGEPQGFEELIDGVVARALLRLRRLLLVKMSRATS